MIDKHFFFNRIANKNRKKYVIYMSHASLIRRSMYIYKFCLSSIKVNLRCIFWFIYKTYKSHCGSKCLRRRLFGKSAMTNLYVWINFCFLLGVLQLCCGHVLQPDYKYYRNDVIRTVIYRAGVAATLTRGTAHRVLQTTLISGNAKQFWIVTCTIW